MKSKLETLREKIAKVKKDPWWRKFWICSGFAAMFLLGICVSLAVHNSEMKTATSTLTMLSARVDDLEAQKAALASENEQLERDNNELMDRLVFGSGATGANYEARLGSNTESEDGPSATLDATPAVVVETPAITVDGEEVIPHEHNSYTRLREVYDELNEAATETYVYGSFAEIPAELPADTCRVKIRLGGGLDQPVGTTLAATTHASMKYEVKITVPYIEGLSEKVEEMGYRMIGAMFYDPFMDEADFDIWVFNPEENPTFTMSLHAGDYNRFSTSVNLPVFGLGAFSRTPLTNDQWLSDGSSETWYGYWGGSGGGDRNYVFDAYSLTVVDRARERTNNVKIAMDGLDEYAEYYSANADIIAQQKAHFTFNRSWFDVDGYAKLRGAKSLSAESGRVYQRLSDGAVLSIEPDNEGGVNLKVNNGDIYWSSSDYWLRVDNVPTKIAIIDQSTKVSPWQLTTILRFLDGGKFTYYG